MAEEICPWGEMAQNYRMVYLAAVIRGDQSTANRIAKKLFG